MPTIDLTTMLEQPPEDPKWLIPNLLCEGAMLALVGDAGVGKSVLCYTFAFQLAAQGRRVLYFDEENSMPDLRQYLVWVWRGNGAVSAPEIAHCLKIEHFSLAAAGRNRYDFMIQAAAEHKPDLIVVDTATPACGITDENDNAQASAAIHQLRRARHVAGPQAGMLVLKHARLDHELGRFIIRGAKTWRGELDGVIFHTGIRGQKTRDGIRDTQLIPDKVRAFGLRDKLRIHANWTSTEVPVKSRGLTLSFFDTSTPQAAENTD